MTDRKSIAITCTACGAESLLVRRPVYDGFKRTGESLHCAACGHTFASEADVPFKEAKRPAVFTEADRSAAVQVFEEAEGRRLCRYCAHYVVNPFTQWCGVHKKEVEATDSCDRFEKREEE